MRLLGAGPDSAAAAGAEAASNNADNASRTTEWRWKAATVVETPELLAEIASVLGASGATRGFDIPATSSSFEVATAVDREQPEVLFVEFARIAKPAAEWLADVRRGREIPLIVAVHPTADPAEMISALRAGASEFLSLPIRPAIYDAMERLGMLLDSKLNEKVESGKVIGILSAKGGCGATTVACCLGAGLQLAEPKSRILVADMDYQSPNAPSVFKRKPLVNASEAFEAVRRLSSSSWREFVSVVRPGVDLLASPADNALGDVPELPEQWRMESLFRFIVHQYNWILLDLGRHLNPGNWTLLQNVEELLIVTAPDVLALYQTRSVLQTLTSRGFDKSRVKLILNRNQSSPSDFWVESIQQMFEMSVFGVVPNDENAIAKLGGDTFELPSDTPLTKAIAKIATKLVKANPTGPAQKAA